MRAHSDVLIVADRLTGCYFVWQLRVALQHCRRSVRCQSAVGMLLQGRRLLTLEVLMQHVLYACVTKRGC